MYDVRLEVNGVEYGGFRNGEFKLSLETMCNEFSLVYSDTWADQSQHPPIQEFDRCRLRVAGNVMVDGWVDDADSGYDPLSYHLSVSGRSTTCDLVDCSATHASGQWTNQSVATIVRELCAPYAQVRVVELGAQGAPIGKFTLQRGETVGAAILRVTRMRHLLVYTVGDALMLAKVGTNRTRTVLRRGAQILESKKHASGSDRYSEYRFKGQARATDEVNGVTAAQMRGVVQDRGVPRFRPLIVTSGGAEGPSDLSARAITERNQRAGRAERLTMKVEGWLTDEGYLWEPNLRVRVTDDWHDVDQDMIVCSATFPFHGDTGAGGYTTTLEVCDPRAFDDGDVPLLRRRRRVGTWLAGSVGDGSALLIDNPNPFPRSGSIDGARADVSRGPLRLNQNVGGGGIYAVAQPSSTAATRGHRRNPR